MTVNTYQNDENPENVEFSVDGRLVIKAEHS